MTTRNGNTMNGTVPRLADDAYFTPPALARAICQRLRAVIGTPSTVIEPSAGAGSFVRAASEAWDAVPIIHAIEPNGDAVRLKALGAHIVRLARWEDIDPREWRLDLDEEGGVPVVILGNPPFSLAEEHVGLSLRRLASASNGWACFLLRASFLAGQSRVAALFDGPASLGGLRYVWHVVGRPGFTPDGKTDSAEYAVLVWQAGYRGPYEGGWLRWKDGVA